MRGTIMPESGLPLPRIGAASCPSVSDPLTDLFTEFLSQVCRRIFFPTCCIDLVLFVPTDLRAVCSCLCALSFPETAGVSSPEKLCAKGLCLLRSHAAVRH